MTKSDPSSAPHADDKDDQVVSQYAWKADEYDARWAFYIEATVRETLRRTPLKSGQSLLDVGCGTGALLRALSKTHPDAKLTGIDPTREMLSLAGDRLPERVILKHGRAEDLPCEDKSFDVALSCNMFHYLREPMRALREFSRVLKPGGALVLTDWCHDYLACKLCHIYLSCFDPAHFTVYGTADCRELLTEAGFRDVEVERYKINWLWGMMTVKALSPAGPS